MATRKQRYRIVYSMPGDKTSRERIVDSELAKDRFVRSILEEGGAAIPQPITDTFEDFKKGRMK